MTEDTAADAWAPLRRIGAETIDDPHLARALGRLVALHEGYSGVSDVIACGRAAVPALREVLNHTEPSGIFEPRARAASALAALGAFDVLIEFLEAPKIIDDPTARLGEEATLSIVARSVSGAPRNRILRTLVRLGRDRPLPGVMDALGALRTPETIPGLVRGLWEDESRSSAASGLRRLGAKARPALIRIARMDADRSPSNLRARRAALALLTEIRLAAWQRAEIERLIHDKDDEISAYACGACLVAATGQPTGALVERLRELLPRLSPPLCEAALGWLSIGRTERTETTVAAPASRTSHDAPQSRRSTLALKPRPSPDSTDAHGSR